jgi:excisionase family DNA binding protein
MEKGEIPYYRFGDRVVRLARTDVEAYLARCRSDAL